MIITLTGPSSTVSCTGLARKYGGSLLSRMVSVTEDDDWRKPSSAVHVITNCLVLVS